MKYNRILLISIPVGTLLSGCSQKSVTPPNPGPPGSTITGQTAGAREALITVTHTQPLPLYTKFNPGHLSQSHHAKVATATKYPNIYAHVITSPKDKNNYIEYTITDSRKTGGDPHSKDKGIKETPKSTIFSTPISGDVDVKPTADQEVIITAMGTDGKCHHWKSDSPTNSTSNPSDSDIRWIDLPITLPPCF